MRYDSSDQAYFAFKHRTDQSVTEREENIETGPQYRYTH